MIGNKLDEREPQLDELRERRGPLSAEVEELEDTDLSAVLELRKQVNQVEFELGRLESELDDLTDRLSNVEDEVATIPEFRDQRATVQADLEDQ
jgi:predicted nuclease with TOPRIM domain